MLTARKVSFVLPEFEEKKKGGKKCNNYFQLL